jgi:arsenite-transporting ATPase
MSLRELLKDKSSAPKLLLFGGKGGVGKTTCAAATALWTSKHGYKVLIISTDPAHSLSDSFMQQIGNKITSISGANNLFALEINPKEIMAQSGKQLDEMTIPGSEMLSQFGLSEMQDVTTFPGMDEAMAFMKMIEYMESKEYDLIIFDTAPTGHTLRFLSLPEFLDSWVGNILKLRMKLSKLLGSFKGLFSKGEKEEDETVLSSQQLEKMKKMVEKAREQLENPNITSFIIVTISEAMAVSESERALLALEEYGIPIKYIIVNQMIPPEVNCPRCSFRREMQQQHLREIHEIFKEMKVIILPQFENEIRGLEGLEKVSSYLFK